MTGSASRPSAVFHKQPIRRWLVFLASISILGGSTPLLAQIAFVASGDNQQLTVIETQHDRVIRRLKAGYIITSVAAGLNISAFVFGSWEPRDTAITVFDTDTSHRVTISVSGTKGVIAVSPDRRRVYVGGEAQVQGIDVASGAVTARFQRSLFATAALAVAPDGRTLCVADSGQGGVLLLDAATLKPVAHIDAAPTPGGIAWAPSGTTLYLVDRDAGAVDVVDVAKRQVSRRIAVGRGAQAIAVGRDGRHLYVTMTGAAMFDAAPTTPGSLVVVDLATGRVAARIPVGQNPLAVALTPDGAKAYVVNRGSGSVSIIRTKDNRVVATLAVGRDAIAGADFIGPTPRR